MECRLITQGVEYVAWRGHLGLSFCAWEGRGTWACSVGMEGFVSACLPATLHGDFSELEPGTSGPFPDCWRPELPCGWPRCPTDVRQLPRLGNSAPRRD